MKFPLLYRGFTLIELLCVLGIVAILAALIIPSTLASRRRAQSSACLSNQRQWGVALQSYTQDYDGSYPAALTATFIGRKASGGKGWQSALGSYTSSHVFICPSRWVSSMYQDKEYTCGYALNTEVNAVRKEVNVSHFEGKNEASVQAQARLVTIFEARPGIIASDAADVPNPEQINGIYNPGMSDEIMAQTPGAIRHNGGANYLFADGHTKWLRPDALTQECDDVKPCFVP